MLKTIRYISKVANTYGKIVRTYDRPINNISKLGNYALSLNYERLATLRPDYGYFNINEQKIYLKMKMMEFGILIYRQEYLN